jgi:LmbE family N-acetylglucosaminyl deacetylase
MICSKDDIKKLGTVLGVWAHPDDDTYSMGGIMAAAVANGQKVCVITATRGEAGVQDESRWPHERLGEIRTHEMHEALKALGVVDHLWLDYPDGGCKNIPEDEAVQKITRIINRCKPDSILTFGPDGMTGHDDHRTVSRWAGLATARAGSRAKIYHAIQTREQYEAMIEADGQFNIFFNIDKPPVCQKGDCAIHIDLDDEFYAKKLAALHCMPSQTEGLLRVFENSLRTSIGTEAFTDAR